jgi:hypothetical protein
MIVPRFFVGVTFLVSAALVLSGEPRRTAYAEIRVVDADTGRGVPLAELTTTNNLRFVTDNAGRIAFHEPGLMGREVYFTIHSHGYEPKKDGFGFAGVKLTPKAGEVIEVKIKRRNLAERLCRLTGEGKYRDTLLLGHKPPLKDSPHPGMVAGQDSVQAVPYKGEIYWFWGDTNRMSYPLGLLRTSGAKTPIKLDPTVGIAFDYFTDKTGFSRAMMPLLERPQGVIWVDGVCTVRDEKGQEKLIAHYSRRKGLVDEIEHGIAVFDDERAILVLRVELPLTEKWRHPYGHAETFTEGGKSWLLFGNPALNVRVPATFSDVLDPKRYEAFTCASKNGINTDDAGKPVWRWQSELPPMNSEKEAALVKAGKLKAEHARFYPANVQNPKERVRLHSGTVRWNAYSKRWIMLAGQIGGKSSLLGEVWYAAANHPTGPFKDAMPIVTHNKQTFYNVCHHAFLDRGRYVHFEGTYTNSFSGNPDRTPRYDYNQVLYRLDLSTVMGR